MPPRELSALVRRALTDAALPSEVSWEELVCFEPSRPTPLYRYPYRFGDAPASLSHPRTSTGDGERAARCSIEAAERRSTFLAEASRALSASLDYQSTLTCVAELAVPFVADFCAVYVEEPGAPLHPVAVTFHDPRALDLARAFALEYAVCVTQRNAPTVCSVLRTCAADCMHVGEVSPHDVCAPYREQARVLSLATTIAVPLVAREHALGVVLFAYRDRRESPGLDLALGEDLAGRAALAVDNARLYRQSQCAIGARDEFLSIASHELRTPSQSLVLGVQMLRRLASTGKLVPLAAADGGAETLVSSVLEKLDRQSRHLAQLIGRLLDVARIQSGQMKLDLGLGVDLAAVTREVVDDMRDLAAQRGCAIELHAEEATGEFDRVRLAQVVSNLLSNALQYGAGAPIGIVVERSADVARLTVRDRGVGIAPEVQASIFEPFKRASSARHYGGLGLGLYVVRHIVSAHGGSVHVDSAPSAGSTFVVSIPRSGREGGA
jgi:signal transduction histidine kinase